MGPFALIMLAVVFAIGLLIVLGQRALQKTQALENQQKLTRQRWESVAKNLDFHYSAEAADNEQQHFLATVHHELYGEVYGDRVLLQQMSGTEFRLMCRITFEAPRDMALRITRQRRAGRDDIQTGDAIFDRRFDIRGRDGVAVARLLDAPSRRTLLKLSNTWDHFILDDMGLDLRRKKDILDPDDLEQHLHDIVYAVEALSQARKRQSEAHEEFDVVVDHARTR